MSASASSTTSTSRKSNSRKSSSSAALLATTSATPATTSTTKTRTKATKSQSSAANKRRSSKRSSSKRTSSSPKTDPSFSFFSEEQPIDRAAMGGFRNMQLKSMRGPGALAVLIDKVIAYPGRKVMVFDFDRTLTNGFATPGDKLVSHGVRGGEETVNALLRAKAAGVELFIVTARKNTILVLEQVLAQLKGAQKDLAEAFTIDTPDTVDFLGTNLAIAGRVYAAGGNKPDAVVHCFGSNPWTYPESEPCDDDINIMFVDDSAAQVHDVFMSIHDKILRSGFKAFEYRICFLGVWWDTIDEELGPHAPPVVLPDGHARSIQRQSMRPLATDSSDYNYHEHMGRILRFFSIFTKEHKQRHQRYLDYERKNGKPAAEQEALPKPKKLMADTARDSMFQNLFNKQRSEPPKPPAK